MRRPAFGPLRTCRYGEPVNRISHRVVDKLTARGLYRFPKQRWKNIRTTIVIERLNGEFHRRVKTQGSLPSENSALVLLYGLVATGQIRLRKIDGYKKLAVVISAQMRTAA
jgi:transposase-like protein